MRRHIPGASLACTVAALLLPPPVLASPRQTEPASPGTETVRLATFLDDRPTVADPGAHYTLYLPASYDPEGTQPVLLVFDPRGRARMAAELFGEAAERYGWILVSSNDTRSDGPWEPNQKAIAALWPEIHRFAIDPERIYATGFSGGAMVAWILGYDTGRLAGIIGVGGRLDPVLPSDDPPFVYWGAAGSWDFNYDEMGRIDELFAREGLPHWLEIFDGPHSWLPPELATQAVGWMELQAMRQGRRERDDALVEEEWQRLMASGREEEESGELLAAFERYRRIEEAFAGLRDAAPATAAARRLERHPEVRQQRKDRRRGDAADRRYMREKLPLIRQARDRELWPSAESLARALEIGRLKRSAEGEGYEAVAARRMLHRVYTQASFYLPRQWLAEGSYRGARTVLEIALEIRDDLAHVWYNLACAAARTGDAKAAMTALEGAVERGFTNAAHIRADEDLASLRDREEFRKLLERLESAPSG